MTIAVIVINSLGEKYSSLYYTKLDHFVNSAELVTNKLYLMRSLIQWICERNNEIITCFVDNRYFLKCNEIKICLF